jgi:tyrosinase
MPQETLAAGSQTKAYVRAGAYVRKDIRNLNQDELDVLIKAWIGIQKNPPEPDNPNPNSFFTIAGFHGEPFRGAGYGNPSWWGGYCNHGNILFPTWHRAYLLCLENALRRVPGCENVTLPYWNEIEAAGNPSSPIPEIFLQKEYVFKTGQKVANPLYSYRFQRAVHDRLSPFPDADYSKYDGYETVRYPFSGLVGTNDATATAAHNQLMNILGEQKTDQLLQSNVSNWLIGTVINSEGTQVGAATAAKYIQSLFAPNYTVFSNTTSAQRWNDDNFDISQTGGSGKAALAVMPVESPHNAIHLSIGGFDVPGLKNYSFVPDANGDMGENDTASFDPIFFFHHCFIDLMFWAWQVKHKACDKLEIIPNYPGTNSVDNQGPTPGIAGGTWLDLTTPLDPFIDNAGKPMTSNASFSPKHYCAGVWR